MKCSLVEKGKAMGKPKMYGMNKTFVPNSKADQKRNKTFGAQKKGTGKKCNVRDAKPMDCLAQIPDQMEKL